MTAQDRAADQRTALLASMANLARFHREHEEFYAARPREQAVALQRHSRTLLALADRWSETAPSGPGTGSPFAGAEDLNAPAALHLDGVLFLEGGGEPAEIGGITADLRALADSCLATGEWLASAMRTSWDTSAALLGVRELADLIGERQRIIADDWQAAHLSSLAGRSLSRAVEVLGLIDFTPAALREDLAGDRVAARRLYSAAELIAHAADLLSESAGLVHGNERRWRSLRARAAELTR